MSLSQSEFLEVPRIPGKGRSLSLPVRPFPRGRSSKTVPLLIVKQDDINASTLMDYVYAWTRSTVALALGYGSLYNHSFKRMPGMTTCPSSAQGVHRTP